MPLDNDALFPVESLVGNDTDAFLQAFVDVR